MLVCRTVRRTVRAGCWTYCDADFARSRTLYFCYSEPAPGVLTRGNSTALARATLSVDNARLENVKVIFSQKPKFSSSARF